MKRFRRLRKSKKGMTLVEVVVALAVVSIVFSVTMSAIVSGYSTILSNRSVEEASVEAQGIADTVVSTIAGVNEADIHDLVYSSSATPTYRGLEDIAEAVYVDNLSSSSAFPDNTLPIGKVDRQFTIERVNNLVTNKPGTIDTTFNGYKVTAAVTSTEGFITVTAFTIAE